MNTRALIGTSLILALATSVLIFQNCNGGFKANEFGSQVVINSAPSPEMYLTAVDYPAADSVTWDPGIRSNCRAAWASPADGFLEMPYGSDCLRPITKTTPTWPISRSHEGPNFEQGSMFDFPVDGGPLQQNFSQLPDGRYRVSWTVDTITNPNYLTPTGEYPGRPIGAGFTGAFLVDNPAYNGGKSYSLAEDLEAEVTVRLNQMMAPGDADGRVVFGVVARWGGRSHYLEVNLMRTAGFDRCTQTTWLPVNQSADYGVPTCDVAAGVYDHRHHGDPSLGHPELVYFYGPHLLGSPLPELKAGEWVKFKIPVSRLIREYRWFDTPTGAWSTQTDFAFYFGIELRNLASVSLDFENYRVTRVPAGQPTGLPCTFAGTTLPDGSSVSAFQNSMVTAPATCVAEKRTCSNGTLSGSYTNNSCTVIHPKLSTCDFNGISIGHGTSVAAYAASLVMAPATCLAEQRVCDNGVLSGSYKFASCTVVAANHPSCTFNGLSISNGTSVKAYMESSVMAPATCKSEQRNCTDGVLSGSYKFASCTVVAANHPSCTFNGLTISHGTSVRAYLESSVVAPATCKSELRTCTDGMLSGSYAFPTCDVVENTTGASCNFNGVTIAHGDSVTAYQENMVTAPATCRPEQRTCKNGTLSGTYTFSSCTQNSPPPPPFTPPDGLFKATWPGYPQGGFVGKSGRFCVINGGLLETDYTQAQYDAAPVIELTGDYQAKFDGACPPLHFVPPEGLFKAVWPGYPLGGFDGHNGRFCVINDLSKSGYTQTQYDAAKTVELTLDYTAKFDGPCPPK